MNKPQAIVMIINTIALAGIWILAPGWWKLGLMIVDIIALSVLIELFRNEESDMFDALHSAHVLRDINPELEEKV